MEAAIHAAANRVLEPLDGLRAALLRGGGAWTRRLIQDRPLRIASMALLGAGVAFLMAGLLPVWALLFGPILMGVPHLAADLRYLVIRPGWHRSAERGLFVGVPLLLTGVVGLPWLGMLVAVGAVVSTPSPIRKKLLPGLGAVGLVAVAAAAPVATAWAMLHLHNVVAMVLWWAWRPGRLRWLPLALFVLGNALILGGFWDDALLSGLSKPAGASIGALFSELQPGLPMPWDVRLVVSFGFSQALHYGAWLRWIPEDDRARYTPRPLVASWRAACADFGVAGALLVVGLSVALLVWAAVDLVQARAGYLWVALFHGYLELAVLAAWAVRREYHAPGAR